MNPIEYVIIGILAVILGLVIGFLYKSKKNGKKSACVFGRTLS